MIELPDKLNAMLNQLAAPEVFIPITMALVILISWRMSRKP
jgi:hypothetical protein